MSWKDKFPVENRYYETDSGILFNVDNMEVLRGMPDNVIDTVITDSPYGLKFMGKKWDYDVPSVELWQEVLRIMKPGGTLLCFAGSRTQHRMAVNIEDAGFILKDTLMWLYGSGFPKSTDISKQIDKKFGAKRKVVGRYIAPDGKMRWGGSNFTAGNKENKKENYDDRFLTTSPATPKAKLWEGYHSHGLKPAYEPIIMAMKPNEGSYAENALKWGVAGLNIDAGRIGTDIIKHNQDHKSFQRWKEQDGRKHKKVNNPEPTYNQGRFPANILLNEEAAKLLDEQSGVLKSGGGNKATKHSDTFLGTGFGGTDNSIWKPNIGGASRFFYVAKASKSERNMGCEGLEEKQQKITNQYEIPREDGTMRKIPRVRTNFHPTVKPLKLMEYLVKLTSMPNPEQIYLDPFLGSGTTAMAVKKLGKRWIGIEKETEYCEIAKRRISHTQKLLL